MKTSISNPDGFVTITFLGLLPLLMTVAIAWMAAETSITQYAKVQHICRVHVLKMQEITLQASNSLIDLNPLAQSLRKEYELAKQAVEKGGPPPVRAAAAAWLLSVHLRQVALGARQLALWTAANTHAAQEQLHLKLQFPPSDVVFENSEPFLLHLKRTPASNITPDYDPMDGFESRQTLRVSWKTNLARTVPPLLLNWLNKTANTQNLEGTGWVKGNCSSTYVENSNSGRVHHYQGRLGVRDKF